MEDPLVNTFEHEIVTPLPQLTSQGTSILKNTFGNAALNKAAPLDPTGLNVSICRDPQTHTDLIKRQLGWQKCSLLPEGRSAAFLGPRLLPPFRAPSTTLLALARELDPSLEGTWLSVARSPQGPQHRGYRSPRRSCVAVMGRAPLAQPERSGAAPRYTQVRVPGPRFLKLPPGWGLRPLN